MSDSKFTPVRNSSGYVDRDSLRAKLPADVDAVAPGEDAPLSAVRHAPDVACCPKFDLEKGHCNMMNIGAGSTKNKAGETICIRQTNRWQAGNMPCGVPKLLQLEFKSEFMRNEKVRAACINVLNGVATDERCPYSQPAQNGPMCTPMKPAVCVRPDGHLACKVQNVMANLKGIIRGPQNMQMVQRAYDEEVSDIQGQTVSRINEQADFSRRS